MIKIRALFTAALLLVPALAPAQEPAFGLYAPAALAESGILRFLLPRFSLKTGIRPTLLTDESAAEARFNSNAGTPVMQGAGEMWYLALSGEDTPEGRKAERFLGWLLSDIGKRAIEKFGDDTGAGFTAAIATQEPEMVAVFEGNAAKGEAFSYANCGRCHVIGERNRMQGIGSTPSFAILRTLPDWELRFSTFYERVPHPAITQLEGVSPPFNLAHPPTIHPVELSLDDLENILTFVSNIAPADLGAPLAVH